MNLEGPIIIVEDDGEDQEILQTVFKEIGYTKPVVYFSDAYNALEYMQRDDVAPFIIISDINMPGLNGFELRKKVFEDEKIRDKCIPYLFLTTGSGNNDIIKAYNLSIQGFFIKPSTIEEISTMLTSIITYWSSCVAPKPILIK